MLGRLTKAASSIRYLKNAPSWTAPKKVVASASEWTRCKHPSTLRSAFSFERTNPFVTLQVTSTNISNPMMEISKLQVVKVVPKLKNPTMRVLEDNDVPVVCSGTGIPLVKAADVAKALKVLKKEKMAVQALTLWKKEADIFFEIYWRKGLYLENVIRELEGSGKPNVIEEILHLSNLRCTEFINNIGKDKDLEVEYFGLVATKKA
eukprot:TRINITY_DN8110_c0_g1_i1.p1 TRINITY_DN8110_c0_g1~~TRINITY_DN8110_c0_g1_i1.p1  ORF type:complete len:206 (+),score=54.95 TRINITY_DN8110_c0_g1_i1:230-847(+)